MSQAPSESDPAEQAESSDIVVNMVAVHREDGGIEAFVKADSCNGKPECIMDRSCDELASIACKGGINTGSAGWISQTMARVNSGYTKDWSLDSTPSNNLWEMGILSEQSGAVKQQVNKLEEHLRKAQGDSALKPIQHNKVNAMVTERNDRAPSAESDANLSASTAEGSTYECTNAQPVTPCIDAQKIEDIVDKLIDAKMCHFRETYEEEIRAMRAEHEQMVQKAASDVLEQVSVLISNESSKVEQKISTLLIQKVNEDTLNARIKGAIKEARESIQLSIQEGIEEKLNDALREAQDAMNSHMASVESNVENKIKDVASRLISYDTKLQQMSNDILGNVETLIERQSDGKVEEINEQIETMRTDIGEMKSKIVQANQETKEFAQRMDTLYSDIDSMIQKGCQNVKDELCGNFDSKWNDVLRKHELDGIMQQVKSFCAEVETKAVETAAQECDEKLGVLSINVEDKLSQDFYRIIEDRVQTLNGDVIKHVSNAIDLKLRGIKEPQNDDDLAMRDAISKPVETAVMQDVANKVDAIAKDIQAAMESKLQAAVLDAASAFKSENATPYIGGCVSNDPLPHHATYRITTCSEASNECERIIGKFAQVVQQCEAQMSAVAKSTSTLQHLNEKAATIIEQMQQCVDFPVKQTMEGSNIGAESVKNRRDINITPSREIGLVGSSRDHGKESTTRVPHSHPLSTGHPVGLPGSKTVTFDHFTSMSNPIHTSHLSEDIPPGIFSKLLCGYSTSASNNGAIDNRCFTAPMERSHSSHYRLHGNHNSERSLTDPSNPVEVKYVNMNGQVIKVTQRHLKLNQLSSGQQTAARGAFYSPGAL
ncbi:Apolipo protein A1 A4, putative [Babesia ovata]|uniref:Apolipo protein A1 A4, putative n=1 Tax=Babesia ovata TaxID=189622 RepID=A0A2H6KEH1_9APIC|nr:Apolipo protein A1 A4, putative [Babesia ovata]GBE61385.1 Apolipo protein A1 A4, putative [Babesia ovata]